MSRTQASYALDQLPSSIPKNRDIGDIHLHVWSEGVQYWVWQGEEWVDAEVGFRHPLIGKTRVLSHKTPQETKLPSWVLNSTLSTYKSRDKEDEEDEEIM